MFVWISDQYIIQLVIIFFWISFWKILQYDNQKKSCKKLIATPVATRPCVVKWSFSRELDLHWLYWYALEVLSTIVQQIGSFKQGTINFFIIKGCKVVDSQILSALTSTKVWRLKTLRPLEIEIWACSTSFERSNLWLFAHKAVHSSSVNSF